MQAPGPPSGKPKLPRQVIRVQGLRLGDSDATAYGSTKGPQTRRGSGEVGSPLPGSGEEEVAIATVLRACTPSLFSGSMKPSSRADQSESGLGAKNKKTKKHQMWPRSLPSLKKGCAPTMQVGTAIFQGQLASERSFVLCSPLAQACKAEALAADILVSPGLTLAHVP